MMCLNGLLMMFTAIFCNDVYNVFVNVFFTTIFSMICPVFLNYFLQMFYNVLRELQCLTVIYSV